MRLCFPDFPRRGTLLIRMLLNASRQLSGVLHVAPEAALGGPLAVVQTGDRIALDVDARRIDLLVDEAEIARRLAGWSPPPARFSRGYGKLFLEQTTQADHGCDFRFLERGGPTPEPDIF